MLKNLTVSYNEKGLLIEGVDARGVKAEYIYDGVNRLKTINYSGETEYSTPQVSYTYDELRNDSNGNPYYNKGRLTKIQTLPNPNQGTPETVHSYDYDKAGQIVNHTQSIGNKNYNVLYGYNLAGQMITEKYPSGKVVNITIDNAGNLQTVADSQNNYIGGVTLNTRGLVSQINFGNGTSENYTYNDRFQLQSQSLVRGADVMQKYDYSYGEINLSNGLVDSTKNNGQLAKI